MHLNYEYSVEGCFEIFSNVKVVIRFHNGQPLHDASRFKTVFEFGFISLDILYAYPEDNGEYVLKASNDKGECQTKTLLTVRLITSFVF